MLRLCLPILLASHTAGSNIQEDLADSGHGGASPFCYDEKVNPFAPQGVAPPVGSSFRLLNELDGTLAPRAHSTKGCSRAEPKVPAMFDTVKSLVGVPFLPSIQTSLVNDWFFELFFAR